MGSLGDDNNYSKSPYHANVISKIKSLASPFVP